MVVSDLLKIESGHTQISGPKIGIPMSKTACINPWNITRKLQEKYNEINDRITMKLIIKL